LVEHYLTAFYEGGTQLATFDWTVPAAVGTVEPKAPSLSRNDATVILRLRPEGNLPLGFFDIQAVGHNGTESGTVQRRFAVVTNTWMKHKRATFGGNEPDDLILWPSFQPGQSGDSLLYVENTSRRRRAFAAFPPSRTSTVRSRSQAMSTCCRWSRSTTTTTRRRRPSRRGAGSARAARNPLRVADGPAVCAALSWHGDLRRGAAVSNLGGALAGRASTFTPRALTQDSTFLRFGSLNWYSFDYLQPRWDPTATNPRARIAF
jgi:hypothetical protein